MEPCRSPATPPPERQDSQGNRQKSGNDRPGCASKCWLAREASARTIQGCGRPRSPHAQHTSSKGRGWAHSGTMQNTPPLKSQE